MDCIYLSISWLRSNGFFIVLRKNNKKSPEFRLVCMFLYMEYLHIPEINAIYKPNKIVCYWILYEVYRQEQPLEVFCKKAVLKKFLKACNFIKKRLQQRCFSVNIAKLLRIPVLKNGCFYIVS